MKDLDAGRVYPLKHKILPLLHDEYIGQSQKTAQRDFLNIKIKKQEIIQCSNSQLLLLVGLKIPAKSSSIAISFRVQVHNCSNIEKMLSVLVLAIS